MTGHMTGEGSGEEHLVNLILTTLINWCETKLTVFKGVKTTTTTTKTNISISVLTAR